MQGWLGEEEMRAWLAGEPKKLGEEVQQPREILQEGQLLAADVARSPGNSSNDAATKQPCDVEAPAPTHLQELPKPEPPVRDSTQMAEDGIQPALSQGVVITRGSSFAMRGEAYDEACVGQISLG